MLLWRQHSKECPPKPARLLQDWALGGTRRRRAPCPDLCSSLALGGKTRVSYMLGKADQEQACRLGAPLWSELADACSRMGNAQINSLLAPLDDIDKPDALVGA